MPARTTRGSAVMLMAALAVAMGALLRRRRRSTSLLAFVCVLGAARTGWADEQAFATTDDAAATGTGPRIGVELGAAFSPKRPAFAGSLGPRYRLTDHLLVGADLEWNPWWSGTTRDVRPGVFNAYATGVLRFPLRQEQVHVRTTLSFGGSRMLFDLVGVPKGSTGIFFGVAPLGLDVRLSRMLLLVLNPGYIAAPAPQLEGTPFVYLQYRFSLGLQLGAS